jgi:hypothetical protein
MCTVCFSFNSPSLPSRALGVTAWAEKQRRSRYFSNSLKGEAGIDRDDKGQREQLLTEIVQDGRRLLSLAEESQEQHHAQTEAIAPAALPPRLIAQDVEGGRDILGGAVVVLSLFSFCVRVLPARDTDHGPKCICSRAASQCNRS